MLFLAILKWTGILFLAVILLLLFLLTLILFVPVCYRVSLFCNENFQTEYGCRVSFLFPLVFIRKSRKRPEIRLHVLGIPILCLAGKEEKEDVSEKETSGAEEESGNGLSETEREKEKKKIPKRKKINKNKQKQKKGKIPGREKNWKKGFQKLSDTIKFIQNESTKETIRFLKEKLVALLKHISPKKAKGILRFGTGDPANTGMIAGVLSMMPFIYAKGMEVTPDFEEKILLCDVCFRGRVRIWTLLRIAISIYFKKEIRKTMGSLKRLKEDS